MTTPSIPTPRHDVVDDFHGIAVPDPYRWLEDGASSDTQGWVDAQNRTTRAALDAIPARAQWHADLVGFMELPVVMAVQVRGDRLILLERERGAQQSRLVVRPLDDPASSCVVVADPAAGTGDAAAAVDWFDASDDGELVAYGVSEGGTENSVLHVARSTDGSDLGEHIPNCRAASIAWDPDGTGFHYTRYPEDDEYHRTVHHHVLGADWRDDPTIWAEHPTPQTWPNVSASDDGRYLLVAAMVGWSRTDLHLLDRETGVWTAIQVGIDAVTDLQFDGDRLIGTTTLDAPRGRVIAVDLDEVGNWTTLVDERDDVVDQLVPTADGFLLATSNTGIGSIERHHRDGGVDVVEGLGVSTVLQLAADRTAGVELAIVTGFDVPATIHRLDGATAVEIYPSRDDDIVPELTVTHVEYPSADGTAIGLFLIHRADLEPGPDTPTILNGYGGFAITESPLWSPTIASWCTAGGLYAIAGLRGGFEHGEEWHAAGKRANKQNVFDDFHAAADWLVAEGLTTRERLAIAGGSNGGLLVGAALTQRPDLCRAVWCAVPLLDMVRFPNFLIARLWTDEYGDPDVAEEFGWLWGYSPYHRVREGERYPAVLFTTAEGDTRVDPLHARKMAAALQFAAADQDDRPILFHQEGRAGHGVGKPVGKRADEQADVLAFFSWQLGL
ncbi:MAG: S9 family peptidase [Ilumatobacter sp.]|nr:S9 family peptidase [Ilumatobacter sp.]